MMGHAGNSGYHTSRFELIKPHGVFFFLSLKNYIYGHFACINVCTTHVCGDFGDQKGASDPPGTGVTIVGAE